MSAEESHRLLSSYEGLQRRGLPAVMEGDLDEFVNALLAREREGQLGANDGARVR